MPLIKTPEGQAAFKARSPLMSAQQRALFIVCDGQMSAKELLVRMAVLGVTPDDIDHLLAQGFLTPRIEPEPATAPAPSNSGASNAQPHPTSPQDRYQRAKPLATRLTASQGLRGFRLNLAVESAAGYDDLLALLPKIQALVGAQACQELARALLD